MHRFTRLIVRAFQLLCLIAAVPAAAAPNHIAAELVAESAAQPGGTVTLAFRMTPEAGWHGYWANPGDAGKAPENTWSLPAGAKVGALQYPVPETFVLAGLMNHVYQHEYALLVPLTLPANARPGERLAVTVQAEWLACSDKVCVPERAALATTVTVGAPTNRDPRFDRWRAALPAPLGSTATFAITGKMLRIGIPLPAAVRLQAPHLFAAEDKLVDYAAVQRFSRKGDLLIVEVPRAKFSPVDPAALSGVLRLNPAGDGIAFQAAPGTVPTGGEPLADSSGEGPALALLLLGALAGGLLLNVMPCVFPILSLKALSLARAGESEAQARGEGLAYTAGAVLACLALGALMLGLRAAGEEIGWAFQLQEPAVVVALLLLATAITANLAGLFEFAVPGFADQGSPQGAFATGLLAAFVATPCTGPFMAAAMGAALLLPLAPALLLFAALGLGLALPFLAIAFVPALRRMLPRPGAWMVSFRRWMALPMGLTALALLWLSSRVGGTWFAVACGVLAALAVVMLLLAGQRQRKGEGVTRWVVWDSLILAALAYALLPPLIVSPAQTEASAGVLPAKPFSEAALAAARASGKPVFVYFTADWCLICKVNERVGIEREPVRDAFAKSGVTVLRGDWTRRDPEITRFLTAQGAAGVPLYLWYPASSPAPQQLPQVLGPETLVELANAPAP